MGGLIALNFLLAHSARVHAAAVWNANFSARLPGRAALAVLAWEKFRLGSDMPSRLLPKLTFQAWGKSIPGHRTLFDWLSRDEAEVDKYSADPLCGFPPSISMWRDVFGFIFAGADDRNFSSIRRDLPVMLVGGQKTRPRTAARRWSIWRDGCGGWAFRIFFQGFTPTPATKA